MVDVGDDENGHIQVDEGLEEVQEYGSVGKKARCECFCKTRW